MGKTKPIYSDRDYLEARFSALDEKMDRMIATQEGQTKRLDTVEDDVNEFRTDLVSAKRLGKAAMGITMAIGAFITWSIDLITKAATYLPHRL
jgi:hypothetical protein